MREMMLKYPLLIIPGKILILKNRPVLAHGIVIPMGNISKTTQKRIITTLSRQWGRPTIKTPVNLKFTFYINKYMPDKGCDTSNAYQFYEDILQQMLYKKDSHKLLRDGAGIIEDDSLVFSHDGTKFAFICDECVYGYTGKRLKSTKTMDRCPIKRGNKKMGIKPVYCPYIKIIIEITDVILEKMTAEEMKIGFTKNIDLRF